ncbi:MAG TPA: hypothetical protein VIJ18_01675 [Microbacteriaceae bacterium]
MNDAALFIAVFLACIVEAVEATTIVLAAGATRNWRSAAVGVAAGILTLAVAVAIAGPAISLLPLGVLRLVIGGLLLVFGLQWMRKAILRASGYKPLHDEAAIYQKQLATARSAESGSKFGVSDWYAFTLSYKGVVLEGLEVVFIVLTFGTNQHNLPLAAIAATIAVVIVVLLGVAVRGPLSRVPENTLKFAVGIMLTAFGSFWGAEGAGAIWPDSDASLLVLVPAIAVFALLLTLLMRARRIAVERGTSSSPAAPSGGATVNPESPALVTTVAASAPGQDTATAAVPLGATSGSEGEFALPDGGRVTEATPATVPIRKRSFSHGLASFGLFWYDFVIGDDWQIAAGVVVALVLIFALGGATLSWIVAPIAIAVLLPYGIWRALR